MYEVEVKFRILDLTGFLFRLERDCFAHFDPPVIETDLFFQHPVRDFAKTDECLRIRSRQGELMITYKGAKVDLLTKTREEIELPLFESPARLSDQVKKDCSVNAFGSNENSDTVNDSGQKVEKNKVISDEMARNIETDPALKQRLNDWKRLLNRLGFAEKAIVEKKRCYGSLLFENRQIIVTLDQLDKIGYFAEFELSASTEEQIPPVRDCLLRLADRLGLGESIRVSYLELCLAAVND